MFITAYNITTIFLKKMYFLNVIHLKTNNIQHRAESVISNTSEWILWAAECSRRVYTPRPKVVRTAHTFGAAKRLKVKQNHLET